MTRASWLYRTIACVLIGSLSLFVAAPVVAQEPMGSSHDSSRGRTDALADSHVSDGWYLWGFLSLGGSAIYAAVSEPVPPASRLVGKSPEYVASYTDEYRARIKHARLTKSCIGGVVGWAAWIALWVAVWRTTDIYYY